MNYHFLYTYLSGAALLLSMMGLWFTVIIPGIDRWSRRFFLSYFLIFMLCCLSGFLEMVFQSYIVPDTVFVFLLFLEILLISLLIPLLTVYLLHYCCENMRSSKLFRAVVGLWAVYLVLSLSIPFIILGICLLVYAFSKKIPARAVIPDNRPKKAEPTHYAKSLNG